MEDMSLPMFEQMDGFAAGAPQDGGQQDPKPVEELSFREAMGELDRIVGLLESNSLELEESLAGYERGVALLASLQKRLSDAEQKVEVLMGELSGEKDDQERDTTLS